jgi:hypothetical protein
VGTSKTNPGPSDRKRLLPDWAQGDNGSPDGADGGGPNSPEDNTPNPDTSSDAAGGNDADGGTDSTDGPTAATGQPSGSTTGPWTAARRAMTSAAKSGSGGGLQRAARRYVVAKGGHKKAASTATAGRVATAGLGSFLSDVATRGIAEATRAIGLTAIIGERVDVALAAIVNAIAPSGTTDEEAVARRATNETMKELFERYGVTDGGLETLNAMTPDVIAETLELSVSSYVYQMWLFELSQKIETRSISEKEAVRLERDVRTFVTELVHLNLDGKSAIGRDWAGGEGRTFVMTIFDAAYSLLGGA